jgi:hypothetical protein
MAPNRRVAHAGLASASLVLFTTLTILYRGGNAPVVGQQLPPDAHRTPAAVADADSVRQTTARAVNVAVIQK